MLLLSSFPSFYLTSLCGLVLLNIQENKLFCQLLECGYMFVLQYFSTSADESLETNTRVVKHGGKTVSVIPRFLLI